MTTTIYDSSGPWREYIRAMDLALAEANATAAVRAWRDADPAPALHALVVERAALRALAVVAAKFLRRVLLVDLHPLTVVDGAAAGERRRQAHADEDALEPHQARIVLRAFAVHAPPHP